jgi:hypothetical protein
MQAILTTLVLCPHAAMAQSNTRTIRPVEWVRVGGIQSAVESELLNPWLLQATPDRSVVFDGGDHSVKAFDYEGLLQWQLGRGGQGPGEFGNPSDLQIAQDGSIWVADMSNARVTVLSAVGHVTREVHVTGVTRAIPVSGDEFIAVLATGPRFFVRFGVDGTDPWTRRKRAWNDERRDP